MALMESKALQSNSVWRCVLNTNPKALDFYYKAGFTSADNHLFAIGKEAFDFTVMYYSLPNPATHTS